MVVVLRGLEASATVVSAFTSEGINGSPHTGAISAMSGDLLETVGSVADSTNVAATRNVDASVFDGQITSGIGNNANGGNPNADNAAGYWGPGHFIEFHLDTKASPLGYDISRITTIGAGSDRTGQAYTIQFRQVGRRFLDFYTVAPQASPSNTVNQVLISDRDGAPLAKGVDAVRFIFADAGKHTWNWYREIDVVGRATASVPIVDTEATRDTEEEIQQNKEATTDNTGFTDKEREKIK